MGGDAARLSLDPFGYWPRYASRIVGLGGNDRPADPDYAFHTSYAHSGGGPMRFTLSFVRLAASGGALSLRIRRQRAGASGRVETLYRERIPFDRILAADGILEIEVDTADGDSCAVVGAVDADTDATAADLQVDVERTIDVDAEGRRLADARSRIFAPSRLRRLGDLVSLDPATLADPVSQLCTEAQFAEPDYMKWVERMALPGLHMHRKQWEFVYILQVLDRYGVIGEGRRGVGFGVGLERLPAVLASLGATVVGTDLPDDHDVAQIWHTGHQHSRSLEGLRYPDICADAVFDRQVSFRPVDMNRIPADLTGFDFAWSSCAFEHLGSIRAGLHFVERSLDCVRPGGIVVHTTELNLSSNRATMEHADTVLFRRRDIERLARRLVALGHEVAPIKYDAGAGYADGYVDTPPYTGDAQLRIMLGGYVTTSFGIVVRKGTGRPSRLARLFGVRS